MGGHALPDVVLRPAVDADGQRCAEIFLTARITAFGGSRPPFDLEDYWRAVEGDEVWVAEAAGEVVGFVSACRRENQIRNLFIDPRWQHRGIGSYLLARMRARLDGPARLLCRAGNGAARAFYERNGWVVETYGNVRPGDGALVYRN